MFTSWTGRHWVDGPRDPVLVPVSTGVRLSARQLLYAIVMEVRNDRPDRPRPTSRRARREMVGASAQTQRRTEQKLGVVPQENYCLLPHGATLPGRRLVWIRELGCRAYQISNSTDVPFGSVPITPARIDTIAGTPAGARPGRIYSDDEADAVAYAQSLGRPVAGYVFVGLVTHGGRRVGLWEAVGDGKVGRR